MFAAIMTDRHKCFGADWVDSLSKHEVCCLCAQAFRKRYYIELGPSQAKSTTFSHIPDHYMCYYWVEMLTGL